MDSDDQAGIVSEIVATLATMEHPRAGDVYDHWRGGDYLVLAVGLKEDTRQVLVAIRAVKHPERGTRFYELADFTEHVTMPDGSTRPRFLLLAAGS
jgi:hypothetical protein